MSEKLPNHSLSHLPKLRLFMRTWGWFSAAAVAAVLCLSALGLVTGCDIHEYVPKAEHLLRSESACSTFIVGHTEVNGVYGNMDVNCDVFTYVTELSEQGFWDALDASAKERGWKHIKDAGSQRRYLKIIPKTGQQVEHMVLEARVGFRASDSTAVVALVAEGTRGPVPTAFPKGVAAEFAAEIVWPKFDALLVRIDDHHRPLIEEP
jgi:hypothetical protein